MKILALLLFATLSVAAVAPTVQLSFLGANPSFNDDGSLASCQIQAGFVSSIMSDDQKFSANQQIVWDGTDQKRTVEYDGLKVTYYQASMLIATIANQERAAGDGTQAAAAKAATIQAAADAAAAKLAVPK